MTLLKSIIAHGLTFLALLLHAICTTGTPTMI